MGTFTASPLVILKGLSRRAGLGVAALVLLVAFRTAPSFAQSGSGRSVDAINFTQEYGNHVVMAVTLSQPAPQPTSFTVQSPPRFAIDLPHTRLGAVEHFRKVGVGSVRSVALLEAGDRVRVVVDLTDPVPSTVRTEGNRVLVEFASQASAQASVSSVASAAPTSQVTSVDFRRGERGEGHVVIGMSDPQTPVDVRQIGGNVVATFAHTRVPESLLKRLDVLDFATPAKYVEVTRRGDDVQVSVTPAKGAEFDQASFQAAGKFVIELRPLTAERMAEKAKESPQFTGQRISLNFQSVDVRALLQIIADVAGTNMVVSDTVNGQIAIRLQNVPWDQALDIILHTKGLGQRHQGNVIFVAPVEELATREKVEMEAQHQKTVLAPLHSELVQINYAKATDIANLLRNGTNSVLSERGRVSVDERTNTVLLLETSEKIEEVRALIKTLDIPIRQVLIESRVVIANDNFDKEIGAQFGATMINRFQHGGGLITTSPQNPTFTGTNTNTVLTTPLYSVNLPVASPAGALGLSIIGSNFNVDLQLSALQAEGRGEVISSPRVITANAKQADIEQGTEIPYQQSTSSGATSVSFKKAVLSLLVTPQITPDNRIIMDLEVDDDAVGENINSSTGSVPTIDTHKVSTQVLVDNAATVVLGGIYVDNVQDTLTKVPLLGDVPVLGVLFRNTIHSRKKSELLIFVTPKIVDQEMKLQ